jgi:hypothetical protein
MKRHHIDARTPAFLEHVYVPNSSIIIEIIHIERFVGRVVKYPWSFESKVRDLVWINYFYYETSIKTRLVVPALFGIVFTVRGAVVIAVICVAVTSEKNSIFDISPIPHDDRKGWLGKVYDHLGLIVSAFIHGGGLMGPNVSYERGWEDQLNIIEFLCNFVQAVVGSPTRDTIEESIPAILESCGTPIVSTRSSDLSLLHIRIALVRPIVVVRGHSVVLKTRLLASIKVDLSCIIQKRGEVEFIRHSKCRRR